MNEICMKILDILGEYEMTNAEILKHLDGVENIGYEMAVLIGNGTVKVTGNKMDPHTNRRVAIYKKG